MKKKISSVIAAIMAALCIVLCFSACDFISYHASDSRENISYQAALEEKKSEYITLLHNLASEEDFYEKELQVYKLQLIEAVNTINECKEIDDLPSLYLTCEEAILSIKTIADYKAEEAQMKAELENAKLDWISKLKALSAAENYREAEKISYEFYLNNGINAINACEDIEGLEDIFNAYSDVILSIKTAAQYESEELAAFLEYCDDKVKEIKEHVLLEDYRLEERNQVSALIDEYEAKISDVKDNDYIAVDNLVRDFKITVYAIPTDSELYADELQQLKGQLISELQGLYKLSNYRDAEGAQVLDLLKSFENIIETLIKKEDVLSQYILTKNKLDTVKTAAVLAEEERINLIEELYGRMKRDIANNIAESEQDEYYQRAEEVYAAMQDRLSLESVREVYRSFAVEISPVEALAQELADYNNSVNYREVQQQEVQAIKEEYADFFNDDLTFEEAKELFNQAKREIDAVKTNDELWNEEDENFLKTLSEKYGENHLAAPAKLNEAKDYYELAEIIDFYAFYQLSFTEFLRDTFRVRLNFDHGTAQHEIDVVYWYCELLRTAVGITGWYENDNDLVIKLIPYALATESNRSTTEKVVKYKSLIEYDSDKAAFKERSDDFDDFAYKKYGKNISGVWNTQQLWYALEHEYVPMCVQDSVAEKTLNAAKNVLRKIIMEGMSKDEKIFNIYSWFAENVQYDNGYANYLNPPDPEKFPDEDVARLDSFFAEGVFLTDEIDFQNKRLAVCEGYAKSYLILLRMEGIESYKYCVRVSQERITPKIFSTGYGSHTFIILKNQEGDYYFSDVEGSFTGQNLCSFHQIMVNKELLFSYYYGYSEYFKDITLIKAPGEIFNSLKYRNCSVYVSNKQQLYEIFSIFNDDCCTQKGIQISLFCDLSTYSEFETDLINIIESKNNFDIAFQNTKNRNAYTFLEFVLYYC